MPLANTSGQPAYDPLCRLTAADYDSGEFFHYSYDPVGNRLTQETHNSTNLYAYDAANRLMEVDACQQRINRFRETSIGRT
jgi:YD repeat-containing protein